MILLPGLQMLSFMWPLAVIAKYSCKFEMKEYKSTKECGV